MSTDQTVDLDALDAYIDELDPRKASERYDRIADAFYSETRLWPPGRSTPAAMGGQTEEDAERARDEWRSFCDRWHERRNDEARALIALARKGLAAQEAPDFDPISCPIIPGDYNGPHGPIPVGPAPPEKPAAQRVHKCMRCNGEFVCPHGPACQARYEVLPPINKAVHKCQPAAPSPAQPPGGHDLVTCPGRREPHERGYFCHDPATAREWVSGAAPGVLEYRAPSPAQPTPEKRDVSGYVFRDGVWHALAAPPAPAQPTEEVRRLREALKTLSDVVEFGTPSELRDAYIKARAALKGES